MHQKILIFALFLALGLSACSQPVGQPETEATAKHTVSKQTVEPLKDPVYEGRYLPLNQEATIGGEEYPGIKSRTVALRDSLGKEWAKAESDSARAACLLIAGKTLENQLVNRFFPCWYGTTWDFNGYTETPNDGLIACGYFISTPLKQAGFNLNRFRLAQQGANEIIESLQGTPMRFSNGRDDFVDQVEEQEEGLYVVGLDNHVGWIHHSPEGVFFIHASYDDPAVVVRESARHSLVLDASAIHVLGAVTTNSALIEQWLTQSPVEIVYTK